MHPLTAQTIPQGGKYDPWDDLGVYMLPDGDDSYFVLTVGEQKAIKMVHGDQSELQGVLACMV